MASPSININTSSPTEKYPCPTEFNVLDFVPKLLSQRDYDRWESLMEDFIEKRGLTGFIDGTEKEEIDNQDYYKAWKRSDKLVQGWILATLTEDIRLDMLGLKTAFELWMKLLEMFDPTLCQSDEEEDNRVTPYVPLNKAVVKGDWDEATRIIQQDPAAVRAAITSLSETALHVAIQTGGRTHFVRMLLEKMTPHDVEHLVDYEDSTALHWAAICGTIEEAQMLVNKSSTTLANVLDKKGCTPLHYAARYGRREMVLYLHGITGEDILLAEETGAQYLRDLTSGELYDIALTLLERKPELACGERPLFDILVKKGSSFPSGNSFNFWHNLIYLGIPIKSESIANRQNGGGRRGDIECLVNCSISVRQRLHFMFWEVADKLVPHIKCIREKKLKQHHALELLKVCCTEIAKLKFSKVVSIFNPAMQDATRLGIPEIVEQIVLSFPEASFFSNPVTKGFIFQEAILWRRERVFNLIYQMDVGVELKRTIPMKDRALNYGLHLAALFGREQQINLKASVPVAVLQMQRELQWFKEVDKLTPPCDKEERNADGRTPTEVFSNTHQDLMKEAEHWMKDTATSCTIVAALIATMVFTAAITVPGGNNPDNGHPVLSKHKGFVIFGISDAVALFSSITSALMFLLILTSRYSEKDFLHTLPSRLIIGLTSLFVSILSMMVASVAILYLVFGDNMAWILIPAVTLASIPATLFGALQFPLLVEMIQSTYGRGIFGKKSDRAPIG